MFKICPSCGDEFQLTASRCRDCGVDLVFPSLAAEPERLRPDEALELLTTDSPWALEELAQRLGERGIPSRIDTDPPNVGIPGPSGFRRGGSQGHATQLAIYVRLRDLAAAEDAAHEYMVSRTPDSRDGSLAEEPLDACPACATPIGDAAEACSSCGLAFAIAEVTCLACGHETRSDRAACPSCGASFGDD